MVLTLKAHRCRTPRRNRSIPTILAGRFGGWLVDVSAVDTGLSARSHPESAYSTRVGNH